MSGVITGLQQLIASDGDFDLYAMYLFYQQNLKNDRFITFPSFVDGTSLKCTIAINFITSNDRSFGSLLAIIDNYGFPIKQWVYLFLR